MKKKVVSMLLAGSMVLTALAGCGSNANSTPAAEDGNEAASDEAAADEEGAAELNYDGEIKLWVADNAQSFTEEEVKKFQDAHEGLANATFTVEPLGEGDAAGNMITDVEAGADIFTFAQDQIARLVAAGALEEVAPENEAAVKSENDKGAVNAATVGDTLYAYPVTSDNGYFMYYDKSVVTDPTSLEQIIVDCEAAGKNFYYEMNSGWYQAAFFFGTGCELTYDTDDQGNFTACNIDYASDKGVAAMKELIKLNESSAFQNGSAAGNAVNIGAIIDGTWDAQTVQEVLGDNYACAKLPKFTAEDGTEYQLSGFSGYKLVGVKPQEDDAKLAVCDALAAYLTSAEVQLARYNAVGWGPSNLEAQKSEEVQSDVALTALNEQLLEDIPQGQYPGDFWNLAKGLGDDIIQGNLTSASSDEDIMNTLQAFEDTCISYAK